MTRLKIALLAGGDSPEREIALQSAAQIEAALDHSKYDITVIDRDAKALEEVGTRPPTGGSGRWTRMISRSPSTVCAKRSTTR